MTVLGLRSSAVTSAVPLDLISARSRLTAEVLAQPAPRRSRASGGRRLGGRALDQGIVASDLAALAGQFQHRTLGLAALGRVAAARMEAATLRRVHRARHVAGQHNARGAAAAI